MSLFLLFRPRGVSGLEPMVCDDLTPTVAVCDALSFAGDAAVVFRVIEDGSQRVLEDGLTERILEA